MSDIFSDMKVPYTAAPVVAATPTTSKITVKDALPATNVKMDQNPDSVEISSKKEKKGPIKKLKGFIANIKKGCATAAEYMKGTLKGIASGAVIGSLIYTAGSVINHVKAKGAEKAGTAFKKLPNKGLAIAAGVIALAANLWNASLNATEKRSEIEHRWTGHKQ